MDTRLGLSSPMSTLKADFSSFLLSLQIYIVYLDAFLFTKSWPHTTSLLQLLKVALAVKPQRAIAGASLKCFSRAAPPSKIVSTCRALVAAMV